MTKPMIYFVFDYCVRTVIYSTRAVKYCYGRASTSMSVQHLLDIDRDTYRMKHYSVPSKRSEWSRPTLRGAYYRLWVLFSTGVVVFALGPYVTNMLKSTSSRTMWYSFRYYKLSLNILSSILSWGVLYRNL